MRPFCQHLNVPNCKANVEARILALMGELTGLAVKLTVVFIRRALQCLLLLQYDFREKPLHVNIFSIYRRNTSNNNAIVCISCTALAGKGPASSPPRIRAYSPRRPRCLQHGQLVVDAFAFS